MYFCVASLSTTLKTKANLHFILLFPKPLSTTHRTPQSWLRECSGGLRAMAAPGKAQLNLWQQAFFSFSPLQRGVGAFLRCQESLHEEHVICHPGISSTPSASRPTSFRCPVGTCGDDEDQLLGKAVGAAHHLTSPTA